MPDGQRFQGPQKVPPCYLQMGSGALSSSATQRPRCASHLESMPAVCAPGQGLQWNGRVAEVGEAKVELFVDSSKRNGNCAFLFRRLNYFHIGSLEI